MPGVEHEEHLWFALIVVEPLPGNTRFDESVQGAYVTTVGRAVDVGALAALIKTRLAADLMKVIEIDEVRALHDLTAESERVTYLASFVTDEEPLIVGDSYSFEHD